jgi:hypothetical protein
MRVVAAAAQQCFLGAAEGSRVPLLALPALHDPLDASVTDDHALFPVAQDRNDTGVVVGSLLFARHGLSHGIAEGRAVRVEAQRKAVDEFLNEENGRWLRNTPRSKAASA